MEARARSLTASATRVPFPVPPRYAALRALGSGGAGTVVLARDRARARLVALKFLARQDEAALVRFRAEARRAALLAHPAVVAVHEHGIHAGRAYLVMDYLDGGNLAQARLEPQALVRTLRRVVDALAHAHALGIVHRDVKPENVLLDRRGRAYLADFGLALDACSSARGIVAGTPLTMSPEEVGSGNVGPASDVFSLGVTLYRQLAGAWPFQGQTVADVLFAIQHDAPRPLRALQPQLPRALEEFVLRCLAKEPERRWPSMRALGEAMDRFLGAGRRSLLARVGARIARRLSRSSPGPAQRGPHIHPEDSS